MAKKNKKGKNFVKAFNDNLYFVKIGFKACPRRIFWDFSIKLFFMVINNLYSLFFLLVILDAIENEKGFVYVLVFISCTAVLFLAKAIINGWYNQKIKPITDQIINEKLNMMIFDKANVIDISCYEDPEFYDNYIRAATQAETRVVKVIENFTDFFSMLISFVVYLLSTVYVDFISVMFAVIPFFLLFGITKKLNKQRYQKNQDAVVFEREKAYVNRVLFLSDYAKDIRLTNIFTLLMARFNFAIKNLIRVINKRGRKIAFLRVLENIISLVFIPYARYTYVVVRMMVVKNIAISGSVLLIRSIGGLTHIIKHLSYGINKIYENSMYINLFKEFINYEPKISEDQDGLPLTDGLYEFEFKNVSFQYNGQDGYSLKNINMTIKNGEKIAIVGHNGAGKTTFIKLLLRLYDVTEGVILMNGIDIREYNLSAYRKLFGTMFQDYKIFAFSIAENIKMDTVNEEDLPNITYALEETGILQKVMRLKNALNSNLTKEFDENGVIFSGGETQKIALSRLYAGNRPIAILDEPSSAIDPIAEEEMFSNMMRICKEKTTIYISHKLSTVVSADRIYLFDNGSIPEMGTHSELLEKKALYENMFRKQAEKYINEIVS